MGTQRAAGGGEAHLGNAGVAAASALLVWVHPVGLGGRAVGPQLAPMLRDAPATVEARVSLEAEATAGPLRPALVQEGCGHRRRRWGAATGPDEVSPVGPAPARAFSAPGGELLGPIPPVTSEGSGLVDGEISIPDHGEVQLGVTILVTFIGVLGERDPRDPSEGDRPPLPQLRNPQQETQKVPGHCQLRLLEESAGHRSAPRPAPHSLDPRGRRGGWASPRRSGTARCCC